jgi:hypothetical protein
MNITPIFKKSVFKKILSKITVFDWIFIGLALIAVLGIYLFLSVT